MAIQASELKIFRSDSVGATAATNGGRLSNNEVVSSVANNLFPDVPQAERVAGSTLFRKFFYKNANAANSPLYSTKVFVENYTPGDDAVYMLTGDQTGMENALTGSEKVYGAGKLDASVSAGATSISVLLESAAVQFFADGDEIRISDKTTIDGSGNEDFVTISGAPTLVGSVVTMTITPALSHGYVAANTRVANVYSFGTLAGAVSNVAATTVGDGDYNNTASPITVPNVSSVYDDWTVTFTSGTTYAVAGTRQGSVGSGSTLSDFSPNNPTFSAPYFTLKAAGFTGAWVAGDTLTFRTTPAAIPLWAKRIVPPAANAITGNKVVFGIMGETA